MRNAGSVQPEAVIFDLGGVVLTWRPELAFEQVLAAAEVPDFMARIGFHEWNKGTDAGLSFTDAEDQLIARFPSDAAAIRAYRQHYLHTLTGMVPGTGAVMAELARADVRLSALTNWSGETFPLARERFGILKRFSDIVVSGEATLSKPDPAVFALACERAGTPPDRTVFVDDSPTNVAAAEAFGMIGRHFTGAERLRADLAELGLLGGRQSVAEPVFHWALRTNWSQALEQGSYPWSSRGVSYDAAGFVHCSFAPQLARVRSTFYADLADSDLVLLRLDPDPVLPIVVEDGGAGKDFPHLFAALPVSSSVIVQR